MDIPIYESVALPVGSGAALTEMENSPFTVVPLVGEVILIVGPASALARGGNKTDPNKLNKTEITVAINLPLHISMTLPLYKDS